MVLLKVFRPAGQGRDGCYFLLAQKVTKESLEAASGEHLACGGAHSHCPQTPITGDALLILGRNLPAGKDMTAGLSCLGPLGACKVGI